MLTDVPVQAHNHLLARIAGGYFTRALAGAALDLDLNGICPAMRKTCLTEPAAAAPSDETGFSVPVSVLRQG